MATRKGKRIEKSVTKRSESIFDQGRQVWLAGLGAFSIAQKRGKQSIVRAQHESKALYARLIVEGKDLQTRAVTLVREAGADAQSQAIGVFSPLTATVEKKTEQYSAAIESGFAKVLHRLGVPTKRELDELSKRIASVSRQIKTAK